MRYYLVIQTKELISLTEEILHDFEMTDLPLSSIVYKCARLYRFLGDEFNSQLFLYECTRYPPVDSTSAVYYKKAGRYFQRHNKETDKWEWKYYSATISSLETDVSVLKAQLQAAHDPSVTISSANPNQFVHPVNNRGERVTITNIIREVEPILHSIRGALYSIVLQTYYELLTSDSMYNIIEDHILKISEQLSSINPESSRILSSIQENLKSENSEDWANAVHSCRRSLKNIADTLYPPSDTPVTKGNITIKVDEESYINRLTLFIESKTSGTTPGNVLNSGIDLIGERLDSIYHASCKGSHYIVTQSEATQYVIYTFLFIGDILSLINDSTQSQNE